MIAIFVFFFFFLTLEKLILKMIKMLNYNFVAFFKLKINKSLACYSDNTPLNFT